MITTDPNDPRIQRGVDTTPRPQSEVYLALSEEEIAKGFVRPVRNKYAHAVCPVEPGGITKMGDTLTETWARDPKFYGGTYCVHCGMHRPVREFVWEGTDERLGT